MELNENFTVSAQGGVFSQRTTTITIISDGKFEVCKGYPTTNFLNFILLCMLYIQKYLLYCTGVSLYKFYCN